ncbi:MAG: hypothetical protein NVS2B12_03890 [Ktedonobacteraceae bacterium]
MADLEGLTLDRYELQRSVGRGGMADVYLAYDPHFEREVAVKVFKREDEGMLRRFVREAQLMASLHNAHLIPVYDSGSSLLNGTNVYYIVMPYMEGGTLRRRIRNSPVPLKTACRYLREIADALDYMHRQGIIHRDIKSSNILLDADGRCYLADFGIARASEESTQLTTAGSVLGTVDYLAPELFVSNRSADQYSDYYSLGILLYEMVTGQLPFTAENQIAVIAMHVNRLPPAPRTFVPDIPPIVERVMLRALEKRPEMRYASATELADAFCSAVAQRSTGRTPVVDPALAQGATARPATQTRLVIPASPAGTRPLPAPVATGRYTGYAAAPASGSYSAQPPAYYPQQGYRANPTSRTRARIVTILALLALLAVVGPVIYVAILGNPLTTLRHTPTTTKPDPAATAQSNAPAATLQAQNATATAVINATATAQAVSVAATQQAKKATAIAIAGATATVQAQASATAGVIQTATATSPTYTDPLTNKDNADTQASQWDQNDNCVFQSDGYHARTSFLAALHGCRESARQLQNFAAQVDVIIKKGASGGLFFRLNTNVLGAYKGYLFEINANGQYRFLLSNDFSTNSATILRDWTDTPALKTGAKNTLQVIARDTTLLFYINGVFLGPPIQDQTFASGSIAFLATSTGSERANVVYSNLSIYPQN